MSEHAVEWELEFPLSQEIILFVREDSRVHLNAEVLSRRTAEQRPLSLFLLWRSKRILSELLLANLSSSLSLVSGFSGEDCSRESDTLSFVGLRCVEKGRLFLLLSLTNISLDSATGFGAGAITRRVVSPCFMGTTKYGPTSLAFVKSNFSNCIEVFVEDTAAATASGEAELDSTSNAESGISS